MGALLHYSTQLHVLNCGVCGVPHAISDTLYRGAMENNKSWTCPNGHDLVFTDNEATRLKKELEQEKRKVEWARNDRDRAQKDRDRQEKRAAAYKGKFTGIRNRVANGVCPCCNRTFQNVMKHMKTKHPNFKKGK